MYCISMVFSLVNVSNVSEMRKQRSRNVSTKSEFQATKNIGDSTMSLNAIKSNPAFKDKEKIELNEEWSNFMQRVGQVTSIVKDMASGDKTRADAAQQLADKFLGGKIIVDENVEMKVKDDRTVINQTAFKETNGSGEINKEAWMGEMSKDAERRFQDRKVRRERADTLKTQAMKAFRREEYDKALSCYNRAIEQVRDNPMLYCDRALTNIKLGNYEKVFNDCDMALRLNENSYKARIYKAKAYKELEETEKFEECRKDLTKTFPQHEELTEYFLDKQLQDYKVEEDAEEKET